MFSRCQTETSSASTTSHAPPDIGPRTSHGGCIDESSADNHDAVQLPMEHGMRAVDVARRVYGDRDLMIGLAGKWRAALTHERRNFAWSRNISGVYVKIRNSNGTYEVGKHETQGRTSSSAYHSTPREVLGRPVQGVPGRDPHIRDGSEGVDTLTATPAHPTHRRQGRPCTWPDLSDIQV
ncbi:hypothetical protein BD779DRAFT_1478280 [Infundibulicybe gibba]|nr:hypothetical protein BD779DRAFT_1478280 [Infundibulicybe gibba]